MKNITFFDQMKCNIQKECIKDMDRKAELQKEQTRKENSKESAEMKLNFQWFDIDQVFAN